MIIERDDGLKAPTLQLTLDGRADRRGVIVKYRILARKVSLEGKGVTQAAGEMGISPKVAWKMIGTDRFKEIRAELLSKMEEQRVDQFIEVKKLIDEGAYEAALKLIDIMKGTKKESIALAAAQDLLDRAGVQAPKKVDQTIRVELSDSSLEMMKKALGEKENTIELEDSEWSYAFEKPKTGIEDSMQKIGAGGGDARDGAD